MPVVPHKFCQPQIPNPPKIEAHGHGNLGSHRADAWHWKHRSQGSQRVVEVPTKKMTFKTMTILKPCLCLAYIYKNLSHD